jgi:hypothetical protein
VQWLREDASAKRVALQEGNPMLNAEILPLVLRFADAHQYLFLASVCSYWKQGYLNRVQTDAKHLSRGITSTFCSSALLSTTRLQWAHACGLDVSGRKAQFLAGKLGDEATLLTAHELGLPFTGDVSAGAACSQRLDLVKWLHTEHDCPLDDKVNSAVVTMGNVDMLRWLKEHGAPFNAKTCAAAARLGHVHILEFLHCEGCPLDAQACTAAADTSHLEVLQWLRGHQCEWNTKKVAEATAKRGNIEMLAWLAQQQVGFDQYTILAANDLGTIEWLYERGCEWNTYEICRKAVLAGNLDILEFVLERAQLSRSKRIDLLSTAGTYGVLGAAVWLREHGVEWPRELKFRYMNWKPELLAWARQQGCRSKHIADPIIHGFVPR